MALNAKEKPSEGLAARAAAFEKRLKDFNRQRQQQDRMSKFSERRDELKKIAAQTHALALSYEALSDEGLAKISAAEITAVRKQLEKCSKAFGESSDAILEPKALDSDKYLAALKKYVTTLLETWSPFARQAADDAAPTISVLGEVQGRSADALRQMQTDLQKRAATLPKNAQELAQVKALKEKLAAELATQKKNGLNSDVEAFLRKLPAGVPLSEVLSQPNLLKWLEKEKLLGSFHVIRQSQTGWGKRP